MKKALLIGASLVVSLGTAAQTLNVVVGEVTYKIPASQAGSMDSMQTDPDSQSWAKPSS